MFYCRARSCIRFPAIPLPILDKREMEEDNVEQKNTLVRYLD